MHVNFTVFLCEYFVFGFIREFLLDFKSCQKLLGSSKTSFYEQKINKNIKGEE